MDVGAGPHPPSNPTLGIPLCLGSNQRPSILPGAKPQSELVFVRLSSLQGGLPAANRNFDVVGMDHGDPALARHLVRIPRIHQRPLFADEVGLAVRPGRPNYMRDAVQDVRQFARTCSKAARSAWLSPDVTLAVAGRHARSPSKGGLGALQTTKN